MNPVREGLMVLTNLYGGPSWWPGGGSDAGTLDEVARRFLNVGSAVAALIAVSILIYGGIQYMISSGDSNKTEKAQNTIIYAVVGLIIVAIAWLVVGFIINILGAPQPDDIDQR